MNRQKINLGVPFTIVRPQSNEKEFIVANLTDTPFDFLKCEILSSTSYPPPTPFVTDEAAKIVKLKGFEQVPQTTSLNVVIQGVVATKNVTVEKRTLLSDEKIEALKSLPLAAGSSLMGYTRRALILFFVGSFVLYSVKGTAFGDWLNDFWAKINAARFVEMASNLDPRIATNGHEVYKSRAFTLLNADYKKEFGADQDLRKLYRFVGDRQTKDGERGFFVTSDLIRDANGEPLLYSQNEAEKHCSKMGGLLLERSELKSYLASHYAGVENFFWPIIRRGTIPEWTGDNFSWVFRKSWLYLKESEKSPNDNDIQDGFVVASKGIEAAFRCGSWESFYDEAE